MGRDLHRVFRENYRAWTFSGLGGTKEEEGIIPNAGKTTRLMSIIGTDRTPLPMKE